jgi:hypothetical protein
VLDRDTVAEHPSVGIECFVVERVPSPDALRGEVERGDLRVEAGVQKVPLDVVVRA